MWRTARAWGYVTHDPFSGVVLPKRNRSQRFFFSLDEIQRILAEAKGPYKVFFSLTAETAMRSGELCGLRVDAFDRGRTRRIRHPEIAASTIIRKMPHERPRTTKALSFYEKVVGFSYRSMNMGSPGEKYHILSRDGVDRGGMTGHLPVGAPPHWLPYVAVDDVDATIARARKLGARIPVDPEDIPGIGRFGVLEDPTAAVLAVLKPLPREEQP
jgi:predicted enzyme related to lactoylglutathione lyase